MKKLLLIDDEPSAVAALRRQFIDQEYELHSALSPEEGLQKARELHPEGVICDYHMPGMNGVELLSILREAGPSQVLILLTAGVEKSAVVEAINRAGVDYFLQKPVDHELLLRVVEKGFAYQDLLTSHEKLALDLKRANAQLVQINSELELEVQRRAGEIMEREFRLRKVVGEISRTIEGVIRGHLDSDQFIQQLLGQFTPKNEHHRERGAKIEVLRKELESLIRRSLVAMESSLYKTLSPDNPQIRGTREPLDEVREDFALMLKLLDYKEKSLELTNLGLEELVKEKTNQLLHTERMASIGLMAAGVAHEINNPNAVIRANTQMLRKFRYVLMSGQEVEEHFVLDEMDAVLDRIDRNSRRIETIVSGLRQFSRKEPSTRAPVEVIGCLEDALVLTRNSLKNTVTLRQELPISLPMVLASSQELVQVFVNLILNGVHACEAGGGELTIRASREGESIQILFQDNGPGIPREHQQRIFEPFFTTKAPQKGVGLGLSISKGIVESFGGSIQVSSEEGAGAQFRIALPILGDE